MKQTRTYEEKCHFIGRYTILLAFLGTVLFPIVMIVFLKVPVDLKIILAASASILAVQIPSAISQFVSFAPLMGPSAMYMMVVTGNFSNMKIPAVIAAKESVGLDQADQGEESDVISTIAMATSTIVCEIILVIGVLMMSQLIGLLSNPVLRPAFANISPAVFGALFMVLVVKNPKLAIVPVIGSVLLMVYTKIPSVLLLPISLIISLLATNIMYKMGWLSPKKGKNVKAS